MNKKTLIQLITLILLAILTYFFNRPTTKTEPNQAENTARPVVNAPRSEKAANAAVAYNYDVSMQSDKIGQNRNARVDYYMLALSWSPAFCEGQLQKNGGSVPQRLEYQCANTQQFGWVIHGLWPQSKNARSVEDHPRFCQGDLPALPASLISQYLPESPGAALLQGEWEKHGACAFESADAYFAKQRELFYSLKLPTTSMRTNELFRWVRKHNPQLDRVYLGASKNELYICYNKQWQPMDCPK